MTVRVKVAKRPSMLIGAALSAAVLVAVPGWSIAASARARPTAVHSLPEFRSYSNTEYRPWIPLREEPADVMAEIEGGDPSPTVRENRAEDVKAGGFLELDAVVREFDGTAVPGVPVQFEWKTKERTQRFSRTTDANGRVSVRRWVHANEKGRLAVIWVTAKTTKWRASRYAWYIAE